MNQPRAIRSLILLLAACCAASALAADEIDLDRLEQEAFQAAVGRVAPTVVRIETVGGKERVGRLTVGQGATTGLIVDSQGHIISSEFGFLHSPDSILVRLSDDRIKPARLVATDKSRHLVLLKIDAEEPLPTPEIVPREEMHVGQWALAVGRTFERDRPNMAVGVLSAVGRVWGKAIQTDAAISPNNYGGPLIDIHGRVLGVLVPLSPDSSEKVAGYEWYDSGIGFAIDAQHIMEILPRLQEGKDLLPGVIGINMQGGNLALAEPTVAACHPNGPAKKAGMKPDDRIVEVGGRQVAFAAGVKSELSRRYAGETVRLVVLRDEKRIPLDIELVAKIDPYDHAFLGILPMRTPAEPAGVSIRYVYPESPAATAGLQPGDVIVSVGGQAIQDRHSMIGQIGAFQPDEQVELEVRRGEEQWKLTLALGRLPEDLPPVELPPSRGPSERSADQLPDIGPVELKVPEMKNDAWAYVPESYDPAVAHGVVVWFHAADGLDWPALLGKWKPLCDAHDLILLAPAATDPKQWKPGDLELVKKLLGQITSTYEVDPTRIIAHGQGAGGKMAFVAGFSLKDQIRAVAAIEAPPLGRPPQNDPSRRLAVYLATSEKAWQGGPIERAVAGIRKLKIPVTTKNLGQEPRDLTDEELTELARWIDTLDRI